MLIQECATDPSPGAAILSQCGVNRKGMGIPGITRKEGEKNQIPGWFLTLSSRVLGLATPSARPQCPLL